VHVCSMLCAAGSTDIQAFIRSFTMRYGRIHPAFFNGTFKQVTHYTLYDLSSI